MKNTKNKFNKYCYKCNKIKSESEFYKNKSTKDKLQSYCKQCQSNYNKAKKYRQNATEDPERYEKLLKSQRIAQKKHYYKYKKLLGKLDKEEEKYIREELIDTNELYYSVMKKLGFKNH